MNFLELENIPLSIPQKQEDIPLSIPQKQEDIPLSIPQKQEDIPLSIPQKQEEQLKRAFRSNILVNLFRVQLSEKKYKKFKK